MKMVKAVFFVLAIALSASCGAQIVVGNFGVQYVAAAPFGACSSYAPIQVVVGSGAIYSCQSGVWGNISSGSEGSGTVTSVSGLSPLFSVSNPTTNATFTQVTVAANTVYGNFTGGAAFPTFSNAPIFSAANLTNFPQASSSTFGMVECGSGTTCSSGVISVASSSSGFPIVLGSTNITSGSTTTSLAGITIDGVSPTTFGFLDATSSIQTQLNAKAPLASPTFTGTVSMPALTLSILTGSTQCLQVNTSGVVSGTGSACGSGGSTAFSAITGGTNTSAAMLVGTGASLGPTGTGSISANELNGVLLSGLATGLLKNTTGTGVPSIATAGSDYLTPTGSSAGLSKASSSAFGVSECDGTTITCAGGVFAAVGGSGTVTHTTGALTNFAVLIGNGGGDIKPDTVCVTDGAGNETCASFTSAGTTNGSIGLTATGTSPGAAPANTVQIEVPSSVTAYRMVLPGSQPASAGQFYTCTAANPSLCSFASLPLSCQPGLGDGLDVIPAGTYLTTTCRNETGMTWTLTAIRCVADAGTATCAATNGAGTALLTGAITGTSTYANGTQSATTTIASGDFLKITYVITGTSTHQVGIDVAGTF